MREAALLSEPADTPDGVAEIAWPDGLVACTRGDADALRAARGRLGGSPAEHAVTLDASLAAFETALAGRVDEAARDLARIEWDNADAARQFELGSRHPFVTAIDRLATGRWLLAAGDTAQAVRMLLSHETELPGSLHPLPVANMILGSLALPTLARIEEVRGLADRAATSASGRAAPAESHRSPEGRSAAPEDHTNKNIRSVPRVLLPLRRPLRETSPFPVVPTNRFDARAGDRIAHLTSASDIGPIRGSRAQPPEPSWSGPPHSKGVGMARINFGRVVVGAIVAGLVINVVETIVNMFIMAHAMEELLASLNLGPLGGVALGGYVVLAFVLGFLIVWTYAAIRPRYGPGPWTAMRAGLAVWAAFYLLGAGSNWLMGIVPGPLYLHTLLYTLPMMLAAAVAGGMMYREEARVANVP
ncbi:MAG TPA: hypothetical protein VMM79_11480 [Longimicrobiales bacterium]|nr:hypothetical protein [Longimicrobiales bacterium]